MNGAALTALEELYQEWLAVTDLYPLRTAVGAYAANLLPGDPVWLVAVGGSGVGKTETLNVLAGLPLVYPVSTLSGEAALLSGTPKRERSQGAAGGLLAEVGNHGVLVLKDFTSVLSMQHDKRAGILAALREIHDGSWSREVGAEGGRRLSWSGKLGLVAGCTTALDSAHAVMSALGDRFIIARPTVDRAKIAAAALSNHGKKAEMRRQLADAAGCSSTPA